MARTTSRPIAVVQDSIDVLRRRLSTLPPSPHVSELLATTEEHQREAERWSTSPPARDESERLMTALLQLHIEVATIERRLGNS
jgi:hypothetical protein